MMENSGREKTLSLNISGKSVPPYRYSKLSWVKLTLTNHYQFIPDIFPA